MESLNQKTVTVDAPARFAIIAPGLPSPKVIIASSEQVSDLIGFYSIREAGLESVMISNIDSDRITIFDVLVRGQKPPSDPYLHFDFWTKDKDDNRDSLFSLVIHNPGSARFNNRFMDQFEEKLRGQLERVVVAYQRDRQDELTYLGQMLATFVSFLLDRLAYEESRLRRRSSALNSLATVYLGVLGLIAAALAIGVPLSEFLGNSSSKLIAG